MDMVKRFVEIELDSSDNPIELDVDTDTDFLKEIQPKSKNFKLFKGKKIFEDKKFVRQYFGQYPTIYVDFAEVKGNNFKEILTLLRIAIRCAFRKHPYLLKADLWNGEQFDKKIFMRYFDMKKSESLTQSQLMEGLAFLSEILHSYYKGRKVFVFIEKFDVPVNAFLYESKMRSKDRKQTINLLQNIIRKLLKGSIDFVEKSLSNACHQLGGILSFSANNVIISRFLQNESLTEFYSFDETEVKSILRKAGRCGYFDNVKNMYDGYMVESSNGRNIEIYSPWDILNYIYYKKLDTYWQSRIPSDVISQIGHPKIRSKLLKMKSKKSVRIQYIESLEIKHIDRLSDIINKCEINNADVDLFLQFLFELGFFRLTDSGDDHLCIAIPNDSVRKEIDSYIYTYDSIRAYYNHSLDSIDKFIESIRNVAQSCDENSVRNLAKSIESMYKEGRYIPQNETDFCEGVVAYMRHHFEYVSSECITSNRKRYTVIFIKKDDTLFVFEWKVGENTSSENGHEQIFRVGYDTLLEEKSLLDLFPGIDITKVEQKLYFGVHFGSSCETSITFSRGRNDKRITVRSSDAKN
ncbi:hypothetical protein PV326_000576 [Microctonus aethiopoides]|nr:hypothetical protein PV326_000576 [Microctonus aethiopoides]